MTHLAILVLLMQAQPAQAQPAQAQPAQAQPVQAQPAQAQPVQAQPVQAQPLTLDAAVTQGLANSRRLAELQSQSKAADFDVAGRRSALYPIATLQAGYQRTNHVDQFAIVAPGPTRVVVYPDIPDNYRTRLDLQWPIYSGGRTDALVRAAAAERTATGKDLDAARADLRLEITRAFYAVVTARETEDVLRRALDAVEAHLGDVRSRLATGLIPPNDVSSAEAQVSHERVLAVEAANQRGIAEADLQRLIGAPPGPLSMDASSIEKGKSSVVSQVTGAAEVAELIATALENRPERQALEQRAHEAALRATAAAAGGRPQIAFAGGYDYANPNPRIFPRKDVWTTSWDASVNVTWTLWDGGRRGAETGEARANADALRTRIDDFDRELTFDVRARVLELESSRQAVTAADDEVRAAVEAERAVGERYRAGVATATEVLDAQVARLQADLDRTRAVSDVRIAEARLERAIGQ